MTIYFHINITINDLPTGNLLINLINILLDIFLNNESG